MRSDNLKSRVAHVADALRRGYGHPRIAPREPPLDALIRTVLSQRTTDANCRRAFAELRRRFPRWERLETASARDIAAAIRSAGLANLKAARLRSMLAEVRRRYGRLSLASLRRRDDAAALAALRALPGIGPKTAACVLLFSLGRDVFPVDTHVQRLCRRLGWVPWTASAEQTQEKMAPLVPRGRALELHINLIRHGRGICRARRPRCGVCLLAHHCPSAETRRPRAAR